MHVFKFINTTKIITKVMPMMMMILARQHFTLADCSNTTLSILFSFTACGKKRDFVKCEYISNTFFRTLHYISYGRHLCIFHCPRFDYVTQIRIISDDQFLHGKCEFDMIKNFTLRRSHFHVPWKVVKWRWIYCIGMND